MPLIEEAKKLVEYHTQFQDEISVKTCETLEDLIKTSEELSKFSLNSMVAMKDFIRSVKSIDLRMYETAPKMYETLKRIRHEVHIEDEELRETVRILTDEKSDKDGD